MPSDRRLHPLSVIFNLGKQATGLIVPFLLFLAGSRSENVVWELFGVIFLVPYTLAAVGRYVTYRYRYDPDEMVIRSGLFFRNERHIPYARIQNIEAVQNVAHRLFRVVEVRVQTGGVDEPEATMTVLGVDALEEMRRRVFADRPAVAASGHPEQEMAAAEAGEGRTVLRLPARELLLSGFIENRGMLVVAAASGLLWQFEAAPEFFERYLGERFSPHRVTERVFTAISTTGVPLEWILLAGVGLVLFLLLTRILSMGWTFVRLYGFRAERTHDAVRVEFGLLTRMTTTIPLKRVQQLTIRETPLHRLTGRSSVRVKTAGGAGEDRTARQREWLAPIIRRSDLPAFLDAVLPGVALADFEWQRVHPRAFRRAFTRSAAVALVVTAASAGIIRWYSLVLLPVLLAFAALRARLYVRSLGWATTANAVGFRRGAFWRYVTLARFTKIQAVSLLETPFDRRHRMARLMVDTAGAGEAYNIAVPYLDRRLAADALGRLALEAGQTEFSW